MHGYKGSTRKRENCRYARPSCERMILILIHAHGEAAVMR
jgi:hypothetical protein